MKAVVVSSRNCINLDLVESMYWSGPDTLKVIYPSSSAIETLQGQEAARAWLFFAGRKPPKAEDFK